MVIPILNFTYITLTGNNIDVGKLLYYINLPMIKAEGGESCPAHGLGETAPGDLGETVREIHGIPYSSSTPEGILDDYDVELQCHESLVSSRKRRKFKLLKSQFVVEYLDGLDDAKKATQDTIVSTVMRQVSILPGWEDSKA